MGNICRCWVLGDEYDLTRWTKNEDILSRGNKTKQGRKMWKNMAHVREWRQLSEKARGCLGDSGGMQGRADLKGSVHRAREWVGNCRKTSQTVAGYCKGGKGNPGDRVAEPRAERPLGSRWLRRAGKPPYYYCCNITSNRTPLPTLSQVCLSLSFN